MTRYYLIWNDRHGIYLGEKAFSLRQFSDCPQDTDGDGNCGHSHCPHCGRLPDTAPVVTKEEGEAFLKEQDENFPACRLIEVHPSFRDEARREWRASKQDVSNVTLPTW